MPMYTYRCSECGAIFDRKCSIDERDNQQCRLDRNCKGTSLEYPDLPKIDRVDQIHEGGTMPYNWAKWSMVLIFSFQAVV